MRNVSVLQRRVGAGVLLLPPHAVEPVFLEGLGAQVWQLFCEAIDVDSVVRRVRTTAHQTDDESDSFVRRLVAVLILSDLVVEAR